MDLRLVRYFVSVVDEGSLSGAARAVHVAQPSLSRQLQRFELDLGLVLFDRGGRRLRLSAAGRSFLPIARDLLQRSERATSAALALASGRATQLRVAAASTTVADIIAPFIVQHGTAGAITRVREMSPEMVYATLQDGTADFAVGTRVPPVDFPSRVIGHAYLWAQCAQDHPLAAEERVSLEKLVTWPLIVMTPDQGVRRMFDSAVAAAGLTYNPEFETASTAMAQALAGAGKGVCILSDDSRFGLHSMRIQSPHEELKITLFGAWDSTHFASRLISETLDQLTNFIEELYGI